MVPLRVVFLAQIVLGTIKFYRILENLFQANTEYRKGLLSATIVLAITVKNLLDTVDKSRVENT